MAYNTLILIKVFAALEELTELKEIKETQGETEDYLKRKPLAWATAKRLVKMFKAESKIWGARG